MACPLKTTIARFHCSGPGDYWRPGPYYIKTDVTPAVIRGRPVLEARLLKEYFTTTTTWENDIAILVLNESLVFDNFTNFVDIYERGVAGKSKLL